MINHGEDGLMTKWHLLPLLWAEQKDQKSLLSHFQLCGLGDVHEPL